MKHFAQALLTATLLAGVSANAQAPDIKFDSVPNALQLPAGVYLGEVGGVATNSRGDIFVYGAAVRARRVEAVPVRPHWQVRS